MNPGRMANFGVMLLAIGVVFMMVQPLPPVAMDVLLLANLSFALIVLITVISTREPLQFSTFPTVLLLATIFRIALNVSTTRLILTTGNPGSVVEAFGSSVIRGNAVVGFVLFLILFVVQFIVITRGAERVSEVAARFTLDAMPGKQMAIDADLNSGLLTQEQAKARREEIQREADFYGAMDGTSKFVRGDAIAAIIIFAVNIIAGLLSGLLLQHLSFGQALSRYTLLSVGDGLVTQIPALLLSTATAVIVTRQSQQNELGMAIFGQLLGRPQLLWIVAGVIGLLGLTTPVNKGVALPVALLLAAFAWWQKNRQKTPDTASVQPTAVPSLAPERPEELAQRVTAEPLALAFGVGLLPLFDPQHGGNLLERITLIRRQLADELGAVLPVMRVHDDLALPPLRYCLSIYGAIVAEGEVYPDRLMAIGNAAAQQTVTGISAVDPTFGLPVIWILPEQKGQAEQVGLTVIDAAGVIATHLQETLRQHAWELLRREETRTLLDAVAKEHPAVVDELVPNLLTLGQVQQVLQNLLREQVPIRSLPLILEALADAAPQEKRIPALTERARKALRRVLNQQVVQDGKLCAILLAPADEMQWVERIREEEGEPILQVDPLQLQRVLQETAMHKESLETQGKRPVFLCQPALRFALARLFERAALRLAVLSYQELEPNVQVERAAVITLQGSSEQQVGEAAQTA
ncbi:MAG: FHIPEP family type III secretion protein [Firmicutes bacterium]|nr:FHIPEP family type III secretion protein [Bacillota bacterium]